MMEIPQEEVVVGQGGIPDVDPNVPVSPNPSSDTNRQRCRFRRDLWEAALQKLEQSNRKLASSFRDDIKTRPEDAEIISLVLKQATELYNEYRKKLLEHSEGTSKKRYVGWNKIHKTINSIMQLKGLLDAGLKLDPSGYGAIAWAATSFWFQMAINYKDKAGSVLDGAEYLTHLLARYALIEIRFITTSSSVLDELEACVVGVYESIIEYLAEMRNFQSQTKLGIIFKSITPLSDSALKKLKDSVYSKDQEVDRWTTLIENECHTSQIKELKARAEALTLPIYQINQKMLYTDEYVRRQNKRDVLDWISTTNPSFHHKLARDKAVGPERQAPGTWILDEPEYRYWQTAIIPSVLWLSGDLGTGKTILISTMIEHIKTLYGKQNQGTLAYFYCSGTLGTNVDSILRSILRQLSESKKGLDMVVEQWTAKLCGKYLLTLDEAKRMIKTLVSLNGKTQTTIIIDALDEISLKDLSTLFDFLNDLLRMDTTNCLLKVLLSSRPEMRVSDALDLWPRIKVNPLKTKDDMSLYISTEVESRLRYNSKVHTIKEKIKTTLMEKAHGMFAYIEFAIDYVCNSLDGGMETALDELPRGLEDMYNALFEKVKSDRYAELARRVILWLSEAKTPLPSKSLIAAVCVKSKVNPTTLTPEEIIRVCHHLVIFNKKCDHFDFRHFSVLEFIKKDKLNNYKSVDAHALLAETCLSVLFQTNVRQMLRSNEFELEPNSLAGYAIIYWAFHCQNCDSVRRDNKGTLKALFSSFIGEGRATAAFKDWRRVFSRPQKIGRRNYRHWYRLTQADFTSQILWQEKQTSVSPFSVACLFDLWEVIEASTIDDERLSMGIILASRYGHIRVVKLLLEEESRRDFLLNVGSPSYWFRTPLTEAAARGHKEVVSLLLEFGADLNLTNYAGRSALHGATHGGHKLTVEELLDQGANIDIQDMHGKTPLGEAIAKGYESIAQLLLDCGADPNAHCSNQMEYPLHIAAKGSTEEMIKALLAKGALRDKRNIWEETPIHSAARQGDASRMKLFLENNPTWNIEEDVNFTVLHKAAECGHARVVELLLEEGLDANVQDNEGKTALHLAATRHESVIRILLERNADPNIQDHYERTPLHISIRGIKCQDIPPQYPSPELITSVIKLLLSCGADPQLKDKDGRTALHYAIAHGLRVVLFMGAGANVNSPDNNGLTPLHYATFFAMEEDVHMLLDKGANIEAQDFDGRTPLHFLLVILTHQGNGQDDIWSLSETRPKENLERKEGIIRLLVTRGADVRTKDHRGRTPLHTVASLGYLAVAQLLMENDANITARDYRGKTALHEATSSGKDKMVRYLVEKGADVTAQDQNRETPLHLICGQGNIGIVELLLANGASIDSRDDQGRTALLRAAENYHHAVVRLLVKKGANAAIADKRGKTALNYMASKRDRVTVEFLIENGADVNARDNLGRTALLEALGIESAAWKHTTWGHPTPCEETKKGVEALVQLLIEKDADASAKDKHGTAVLHMAAQHGLDGIMRSLLNRKASVIIGDMDNTKTMNNSCGPWQSCDEAIWGKGLLDIQDKTGHTALHLASVAPSEEVVQLLLERGAMPNIQNDYGQTALHLGVEVQSLGVTELLIRHGVHVHIPDEGGKTAIHVAGTYLDGRTNAAKMEMVLRLLLENKSDANSVDNEGRTALHEVIKGHQGILIKSAQVLLENGADPNIQDNTGKTPLHEAASVPSRRQREYETLIDVFLRHGSDLDIQDKNGGTPLHIASMKQDTELVQVLLKKGSDPNIRDRDGRTLLHMVSAERGIELARAALEKGGNPNIQDNNGRTPLHIALTKSNRRLARILLENGANPNIVDKEESSL